VFSHQGADTRQVIFEGACIKPVEGRRASDAAIRASMIDSVSYSARVTADSATGCRSARPIAHAFKALSVGAQPSFIGIQNDLQHIVYPIGQVRVQAVVHPLALAPILKDGAASQLG